MSRKLSPGLRGRLAFIVGPLVGLVVGVSVAYGVQHWQEERETSDMAQRTDAFFSDKGVPEPGDAIRELLDQDSRVVVDPLLADQVSDQDVRRAEQILADSPVPARIAYLTYPDLYEDGYTASGAGPQWWTNVGEQGHYVILWDSGLTAAGAVGLESEVVMARTKGQPGPALVRIAEEMTTWEAVPLPTEPQAPSDFDYWDGTAGGLAAAGMFGVVIVVPLFFLLRWFVGERRRKVI